MIFIIHSRVRIIYTSAHFLQSIQTLYSENLWGWKRQQESNSRVVVNKLGKNQIMRHSNLP